MHGVDFGKVWKKPTVCKPWAWVCKPWAFAFAIDACPPLEYPPARVWLAPLEQQRASCEYPIFCTFLCLCGSTLRNRGRHENLALLSCDVALQDRPAMHPRAECPRRQ